jgi:hypothetical protein
MSERRLGRRQPGYRHPVGGATHVVQPHLVAEVYRGWIATVLTADANL